jgi:hypothetical protein
MDIIIALHWSYPALDHTRENIGKSVFLTIQLLLKFGFDHRTPKPVIFGHQTIKTVQI